MTSLWIAKISVVSFLLTVGVVVVDYGFRLISDHKWSRKTCMGLQLLWVVGISAMLVSGVLKV